MTTDNSRVDDGGPAFPSEQHETQSGSWNQTYEPGMSLRDWFAGQALSSIGCVEGYADYQQLASDCYAVADTMLAARKGGGK